MLNFGSLQPPMLNFPTMNIDNMEKKFYEEFITWVKEEKLIFFQNFLKTLAKN